MVQPSLTSLFKAFLLGSFVYLRLISHLSIYLLLRCLPFHSGPVSVNCVMPFNSKRGLKRALNEKNIDNVDRVCYSAQPDGQLLLFLPSPPPRSPPPALPLLMKNPFFNKRRDLMNRSATNTANCLGQDANLAAPVSFPGLAEILLQVSLFLGILEGGAVKLND